MKNIEKYKETNDALDAWRQSVEGGVYLSFDEWAHREYETPHQTTTWEAAKSVIDEWFATGPYVNDHTFGLKIIALKKAFDREKSKPGRNFNRFENAEDADAGFVAMCKCIDKCEHCRLHKNHVRCSIAWLYEKAKKEASK